MAIKKMCPKCNRIINVGQSYCIECKAKMEEKRLAYLKKNRARYDKAYDEKRDKRLKDFYNSVDWYRLRNSIMTESNYLCQDCLKDKLISAADEVHHIVPIRVDWSSRLDKSNLVCLCNKCHKERHRKLNRYSTINYKQF